MTDTQTPTLLDAITRLYEDLSETLQAHDELTDTQVREALAQALWQGFVKPVPGYELPETFYMFTDRANAALHSALSSFLWRCNLSQLEDFGPGDRADALEALGEYVGVHLEKPAPVPTPLRRTFIRYGRAWYRNRSELRQDIVDEVNLEVWQGDVSLGSVHIEWVDLGESYAPRLVAFDDGWAALAAMSDVISELGQRDDQNVNPIVLCEILVLLGFEDVTPC